MYASQVDVKEMQMSWLLLIIIGAVVLAFGLFAPIGAPGQMVCRFIGGFLLLLGVVLLLVGVVRTSDVHDDVDVDGAPPYSLVL